MSLNSAGSISLDSTFNGADILMKIPFIEQSKSNDDFRAFRISVSHTANLGLVSNVKIDIGHT
jgi:hypothetical protein